MLQTGFGSPTGICVLRRQPAAEAVYQGNTLIHCDAGPREVRAFTRKPKGAGYERDKSRTC